MKHFAAVLFVSVLVASAASMAVERPTENELAIIQPKVLGFITDFYNLIVAEPINSLASSLAGMVAQLTAGLAINGIGKRDVELQLSNFVEQFKAAVLAALEKAIEKLNTIVAQINGSKQLQRGIFDDLLNQVSNSIYDIANQAVQNLGMTITEWLLSLSNGNAQGKRQIPKGIFDDLLNQVSNSIYDIANQAVQNLGMTITEWLLSLTNGNAQGKRQIPKGFFDDIMTSVTNGIYNIANQAVQAIAIGVTEWLLNLSNGGAQGKRQIPKGFFDDIMTSVTNGIYNIANQAVQAIAIGVTEWLLNLSNGGAQGKRQIPKGIFDMISNIQNSIHSTINSVVQSLALTATEILINISQNGILPIIGNKSYPNGMTIEQLIQNLLQQINDLTNTINQGSGSHLIGK